MSLPIPTYIILFAFTIIAIYSLIKNTFEYLFVSIYALLPNYFAYEISHSLPLISVSRILILILLAYSLWRKKSLLPFQFSIRSLASKLLLLYFVLRLITNLYYVFTLTESLKTIFSLVFEEFILIIVISVLFTTKEKVERALQFIVYTSGVVFVIAILESLTGFNASSFLYTVQRDLLNEHYVRLGLLRSEFTFGIPSFFATYCVLMVPFILYFYEKQFRKRYLLILTLDIFALIHSGCRAQMFFMGLLILIIWLCNTKELKIHYLKTYGKLLLISLSVILVLSLSNEHLNYYYTGTAKSLLNEIGFDFDLNAGAPENVVGFGSNQEGTYSRTVQFSGIPYALGINPLFGLGSGAQNRDDVMYFWNGSWKVFHTYDVGYVAVIMDEGLLGLLAFVLLLSNIFVTLKSNLTGLNKTFMFVFLAYLLCLLANDLLGQTFWIIYSLFYSYNKWNDSKNT